MSQQVSNAMVYIFLKESVGFNVTLRPRKLNDDGLAIAWDLEEIATGDVDLNFEVWWRNTTDENAISKYIPYKQDNGVQSLETFYAPHYVIEEFPELAESLSATTTNPDLLQRLINDDDMQNRTDTFSILYGNPEWTVSYKGPQIIDFYNLPAVM